MIRLALIFGISITLLSCNYENKNNANDTTPNNAMDTSTSTLERDPSNHIKGAAGFLFIDDGGSGEIPVIFLHSFAGNSTHWINQLKYLRENRRAIAFDFRAHGKSDSSSSYSYSAEALAGDIAAVGDSLDLERFVLVGHSQGGSAAIAYADTHPTRVAGLVLVGTPGKTSAEISKPVISSLESSSYQKVMDDYMKRLVADAKPEVSSQVNAEAKKLSKKTSIAFIKGLFEFDPTEMIKRYPGPKLFIATSGDTKQPNALVNQVSNQPKKIIEGTSHWPQLDKPDEFNQILNEFLKKIK